MLWVCECKDYSGAVPVNDVEEFRAKLDQIAGVSKKGVLAISGALQGGALKYARANGIGVIRLLPDDQVRHVLYNISAVTLKEIPALDPSEFHRALTHPDFVGENRDFDSAYDGYFFGDWRSILSSMLR